MTILAVHILGASSIMGSINIITTILNMRAPGMTLMKMPLFVWTWLITAYLLIAVMPVLAGAVTMLLTDRHFGTSFFNAAGGGDPTMFLHIFWFFGHPEVYIMILPAFGIVSQIIPAFARKPLFGYASMVYATASIAILSFIVWGHHMFTVGMPAAGNLFFMYATMLIAVPTGVKIFNWISTMWQRLDDLRDADALRGRASCACSPSAASRAWCSRSPRWTSRCTTPTTWWRTSTTCWCRARSSRSSAGVYFWLPKWTGNMYNEGLGKLHFWLSMIGFNVAFFPQHFLGLAGMPRRIPDYALQFAEWNMWSSDRRLHLRLLAAALPLHRDLDASAAATQGRAEAVGRRRLARVDAPADAGAVPHLRDRRRSSSDASARWPRHEPTPEQKRRAIVTGARARRHGARHLPHRAC